MGLVPIRFRELHPHVNVQLIMDKGPKLSTHLHTVCIISESAALSAVLNMVLAGHPQWRVRCFDTAAEFEDYARIADVDLVVWDRELGAGDRVDLDLYAPGDPDVIALTRGLSAIGRDSCAAGGIDEVLIKPMSPVLLEERVKARLAARKAGTRRDIGPSQFAVDGKNAGILPGNVVSLSAWRQIHAPELQ